MKLFILFGSLCVTAITDTNQVFCRDFWYPNQISLEECESLAVSKSIELKKNAEINNLDIKLMEFRCIDSGGYKG